MARSVPGWTKLTQNEFKVAILKAAKSEPDLCERLRLAIKATAERRGVRRDLRDQYLRWVGEVEAALAAVAEAESLAQPESPQAA